MSPALGHPIATARACVTQGAGLRVLPCSSSEMVDAAIPVTSCRSCTLHPKVFRRWRKRVPNSTPSTCIRAAPAPPASARSVTPARRPLPAQTLPWHAPLDQL